MVSTPNFDELKDACHSDDLKDCFKFLKVSEWSNGLREKIVKFGELMDEGQSFSHFDVAAMDGLECLIEAQATNGEILQALVRLLDVLRQARAQKRRHVMVMEVHD
ncbi:hypothetical protein CTI12_AA059180 [Artemisia annua]|uniref:Uncharacterized protein n=1 Tax=Artemisia annua TaxID=35608 RepID=A0A2U1PX75_ARTAN|nr:hypothetical protein CTI12_AA059180 [Artemisia annua]